MECPNCHSEVGDNSQWIEINLPWDYDVLNPLPLDEEELGRSQARLAQKAKQELGYDLDDLDSLPEEEYEERADRYFDWLTVQPEHLEIQDLYTKAHESLIKNTFQGSPYYREGVLVEAQVGDQTKYYLIGSCSKYLTLEHSALIKRVKVLWTPSSA